MGNIFVWMVFLPLFGWTNQGPDGAYVTDIAVDYSSYMYAVTTEGIYKGSPQGIWDDITPQFWGVGINEITFITKPWLCTDGGLYTLDGNSWQKASGLPEDAVVGVVDFSNHLVAGTREHGLWASADGGKTFVPVPEGWEFPSDATITAIASSPVSGTGSNHLSVGFSNNNGNQIYVLESADSSAYHDILSKDYLNQSIKSITCLEFVLSSSVLYLYIGTDNGVTWIKGPISAAPEWSGFMQHQTYIYDLEGFDDFIYLACYGGVHRNSPGYSDEWAEYNQGIASLFVYDLAAKDVLVAGASDGAYTMNSSSGDWGVVEGLRAHTFYSMEISPDQANAYAVSSLGGGLYYTEGGGPDNWGHQAKLTPFAFDEAVGGTNGNYRLYAAGLPSTSTSIMGDAWQAREFPDASAIHAACNPEKPDEVWFIVSENPGNTSATSLLYSIDAGVNYIFEHSLGEMNVTDLVYSTGTKMLYIADANQKSVWRMDNPQDAASLKRFDFTDGIPVQLAPAGDRLYLLTSIGDIFLSTDNGENWQLTPSKPGDDPSRGIATDPSYPNLLLASDYGYDPVGMYASVDSGATWIELNTVPGRFKCCAIKVVGDMGDQYEITAYTATHRGVFSQTSSVEVDTGGGTGEVLNLTITATAPNFRPEIGEVAQFQLGGRDLDNLNSWELEITDASTPGAEPVYTVGEENTGPPESLLLWDGYTDEGYMASDDEYRVIFSGSNENGSGADTAYIKLIIGRPPQSTIREATKGSRKLTQLSDIGEVCYLSRQPLEGFLTGYDPSDGSFINGSCVSNSRDDETRVVTSTSSSGNDTWTAWVDEWDGSFWGFICEDQDCCGFTTGTDKISNMAIAVSGTGTPVIAAATDPPNGLFFYVEGATCNPDGEFTEPGQAVSDLELVPASDGVHILYIDEGNTIHDAVWTAPGSGFDRSANPEIGNSMELTATSAGSDTVYLFYLSSGGELFLREYSTASGWEDPYALTPHLNGASPRGITCTVDDEGSLTVAWQEAGDIRFIQRIEGTWSAVGEQTESGVASFPQLPARVFGTDQPLIAWTEETPDPFYRVQVSELGEAPVQDTFTITLDFPQTVTHGDTFDVAVNVNPPAEEIYVWVEDGPEPDDSRLWENPGGGYDSLTATYANTDAFPLGRNYIGAEGVFKGVPYTVEDSFNVTPGESTPRLYVDYPASIVKGDTMEINVTGNRTMDFINVDVEVNLGGQTVTPTLSYRDPPQGSSGYDSLYAAYYTTGTWDLGTYPLFVWGKPEGDFPEIFIDSLTFRVVEEYDDSSALVNEEHVFLVPNPAVNEGIITVYYDLNYDARVSLEIYNVRGKRLMNYEVETGEIVEEGPGQTIEVDISGLGADVYMYRLIVDAVARDGDELYEQGEEHPTDEDLEDKVGTDFKLWESIVKPFVVVR
ncbi:hypothetical protein GF359_02340 [candidate division WOR-3 bacterium]|uniref:Uncharacterized protein n=1 Tax=candidate division WOR-3 bacterium TaxID=2052148 RepID=A0A9D5QBW6_UNCW3|nr:hypothetical protein [candidate division WOR-3 bacterium]MBD3364033.1 hypothetical protein [candidate division WOR-3 bacterium]